MPQPKPTETRAYLYNISYEPTFLHDFFDVPLDAIVKLDAYYPRLEKDPAGCITELINLCGQYPRIPQFKNFLGVAYQLSGNSKKANEVNNLIIAEHPGYLFAKINKAYEYLSLNQPAKVLELLGKWLEIKELYPERDTFHVGEVLAFYKLAFHYHMTLGNLDIAQSQLQAMENIDPDHPDTGSVRRYTEQFNNRFKAILRSPKPAKRKK